MRTPDQTVGINTATQVPSNFWTGDDDIFLLLSSRKHKITFYFWTK